MATLDSTDHEQQYDALDSLSSDIAYLQAEIVKQRNVISSDIPVDTPTLLRRIQRMEVMMRNMIAVQHMENIARSMTAVQLRDTAASTPPVTTAPTAT